MSTLTHDTIARLADPITVEIDDDVRERHLEAIAETLTSLPTTRARRRRPRRAILLFAAGLIALPVGAAFASEDALPGDVLYPVKLVVEPVLSIFDTDVRADRRVDELDRIVDLEQQSPASVTDAVDRATDAVSDLPESHPIRQRFDRIIDRIEESDVVVDDEIVDPEPTDRTDTAPTDRTTTTSTTIADHRTDSTTTTAREDDRARDG